MTKMHVCVVPVDPGSDASIGYLHWRAPVPDSDIYSEGECYPVRHMVLNIACRVFSRDHELLEAGSVN